MRPLHLLFLSKLPKLPDPIILSIIGSRAWSRESTHLRQKHLYQGTGTLYICSMRRWDRCLADVRSGRNSQNQPSLQRSTRYDPSHFFHSASSVPSAGYSMTDRSLLYQSFEDVQPERKMRLIVSINRVLCVLTLNTS